MARMKEYSPPPLHKKNINATWKHPEICFRPFCNLLHTKTTVLTPNFHSSHTRWLYHCWNGNDHFPPGSRKQEGWFSFMEDGRETHLRKQYASNKDDIFQGVILTQNRFRRSVQRIGALSFPVPVTKFYCTNGPPQDTFPLHLVFQYLYEVYYIYYRSSWLSREEINKNCSSLSLHKMEGKLCLWVVILHLSSTKMHTALTSRQPIHGLDDSDSNHYLFDILGRYPVANINPPFWVRGTLFLSTSLVIVQKLDCVIHMQLHLYVSSTAKFNETEKYITLWTSWKMEKARSHCVISNLSLLAHSFSLRNFESLIVTWLEIYFFAGVLVVSK